MSLDEASIPAPGEEVRCTSDNSKDCEEWREWVTKSLLEGNAQFEAHQKSIAENTALTEQIKKSTDELLSAFETVKGGASLLMKFGKWANRLARWAVPIVTLFAMFYAILHGQWPRPGE
jgi:hypothetical protein